MTMRPPSTSSPAHRSGSVYLVTLITVAAIASMVMIGYQLRTSNNARSAYIESMSETSTHILSATELALQTIASDEDWVNTAQGAKPIPSLTLQDTTLSTTVLDADTLAAPSDTTSTYRLTLNASSTETFESAQIDVLCAKIDYLAILERYDANHYWPMNEPERSSTAIEQILGCDGAYLDTQVPGTSTNDEQGVVPVFARTNDHIEVPGCNDMRLITEGSVTMWIRTPTPSGFQTLGLIGMRTEPGGPAALSLSTTGSIIGAYFDDDERYELSNYATSAFGVITAGQWHHVLLTWGPDGVCIYVDGVQEARNAGNTDTLFSYGGRSTPDLHIGRALYVLSNSTTEVGYSGSIAHVAILEQQLTADQAAELATYKPDLSVLQVVEGSWARVLQD